MVQTKLKIPFLPYSRQNIDEDDINCVVDVLKSDWLTQGPTIAEFEKAFAEKINARHVIACNTGTAALHLTMLAQGISSTDIVVTTPITFIASANCARFVGASVKFVDVDSGTALMSLDKLEEILINDKSGNIKAVILVHFAGQAVDLPEIHKLCSKRGIAVVDDCCHALGGWFESEAEKHYLGGNKYSAMSVFSFHPVKHIATGEGGAVATNDDNLAAKLRQLRNHGIAREEFVNKDMAYSESGDINPWYYEMQMLSPNYRLNDIQAALGISQLKKIDFSLKRRAQIANLYDQLIRESFAPDEVRPLVQREHVYNAYHLYVLQIDFKKFRITRAELMNKLRAENIGTQVHYIPVHLQPYYRTHSMAKPGDFPNAEKYYDQALSIPMYPQLTDPDCERVISTLKSILKNKS